MLGDVPSLNVDLTTAFKQSTCLLCKFGQYDINLFNTLFKLKSEYGKYFSNMLDSRMELVIEKNQAAERT